MQKKTLRSPIVRFPFEFSQFLTVSSSQNDRHRLKYIDLNTSSKMQQLIQLRTIPDSYRFVDPLLA